MRAVIAVVFVWALVFAVPFAVYGCASAFLELKPPSGSALRFLSGVAITKLGTAVAFVALFALAHAEWRSRWILYAAIWFLAFAASEIGDVVRSVSSPAEAALGILSEAIYAPVSAFAVHRLFR